MTTGGSHSTHQALQFSFHSYSHGFEESSLTTKPGDSKYDHLQYNNIHLFTAKSSLSGHHHQQTNKARTNNSRRTISRQSTHTACPDSPPKENLNNVSLRKSSSLKDLFFSKHNSELKPPIQTRTKFADIVHKHLLPLNFISSSKRKQRQESPVSSCPTLTVTPETPREERRIDDTDTDTHTKNHFLSIPNINDQILIDNLSKTDAIFTTSFTHSTKTPVSQFVNREKSIKTKSRSVQNLNKVTKQNLVRSYSDVPSTSNRPPVTSERQKSISPFLQSKMFKNNHVSQILEHLFIGSVEAAYNEPLLCKLKIDCLLDMTNVSSSMVPSNKKLHCPCMCAEENQHFRSRLIIQVDNDEKEDIQAYFSDINKFIHGAKRLGKRVLVFSFEGKSRAPTAAIQYLMEFENFLLREAYNLVKNQRPCMDINPGYMARLEAIERDLFPDAKHSMSFGNEYLNIADPQAIKCAWVDCTDS